jgi:hypothetical protein
MKHTTLVGGTAIATLATILLVPALARGEHGVQSGDPAGAADRRKIHGQGRRPAAAKDGASRGKSLLIVPYWGPATGSPRL